MLRASHQKADFSVVGRKRLGRRGARRMELREDYGGRGSPLRRREPRLLLGVKHPQNRRGKEDLITVINEANCR